MITKAKTKITDILSEKDIIEVIQKVSIKQSTKPHSIYSVNDLKQFVACLCWEKLDDFDISKQKATNIKQSLENWLSSIAKKRLINLHRDTVGKINKKLKKDSDFSFELRRKLSSPVSIDKIEISYNANLDNLLEYEELFNKIINELNLEESEILEALLSGEKIQSKYRIKLFDAIQRIITNE